MMDVGLAGCVDVYVVVGIGVPMVEWWRSEEGRETRRYKPYMLGQSSEMAALDSEEITFL